MRSPSEKQFPIINDLIVQVAGTALKATAPMFGETKTIISLLVSGEEVGFRKLSVAASASKE